MIGDCPGSLSPLPGCRRSLVRYNVHCQSSVRATLSSTLYHSVILCVTGRVGVWKGLGLSQSPVLSYRRCFFSEACTPVSSMQ